ncbi:hypothetical protein N9I98_03915 [Flavobacteriales bacterium]|nr:hypothetical protein [Flavobacteriales bacterium]
MKKTLLLLHFFVFMNAICFASFPITKDVPSNLSAKTSFQMVEKPAQDELFVEWSSAERDGALLFKILKYIILIYLSLVIILGLFLLLSGGGLVIM